MVSRDIRPRASGPREVHVRSPRRIERAMTPPYGNFLPLQGNFLHLAGGLEGALR